MTTCTGCETLSDALEKAARRNGELERRIAELEATRAELESQLAEMSKLCELQQADLDRYKKAYEASRPNHPERAPREQLQLAFERVLETFQIQAPANDATEADDSIAAAPVGMRQPAADATGKRRSVIGTAGATWSW